MSLLITLRLGCKGVGERDGDGVSKRQHCATIHTVVDICKFNLVTIETHS